MSQRKKITTNKALYKLMKRSKDVFSEEVDARERRMVLMLLCTAALSTFPLLNYLREGQLLWRGGPSLLTKIQAHLRFRKACRRRRLQ